MTTLRTNLDGNNDELKIDIDLDLDNNDHLNNTETNALLNIEHDKFDQLLQQMYYSRNCQYFYIALLVTGTLLVVTTIVDGFKVADSPTFIAVELLLNITISVDFAFRVRMAGFKKYLTKSHWNKLDFLIVFGCNILFLITMISYSNLSEEISEEMLLIFWSIAQSLRMIVFAKK